MNSTSHSTGLSWVSPSISLLSRLVSIFRRGWNLILVALLDQAPLPLGRFVPEPWPAVPVPEPQTPSLPVQALPQAA